MAYSELVKNFEKVRDYMRQFYVYGFKCRSEYDTKSVRSYDDERRRIESWLGDYMRFVQSPEGKRIFLSIDSRTAYSNPFYKAWKTKSFTDGDITLHFILFDILCDPSVEKTLTELVEEIDAYLMVFAEPMSFDESTIRKKLKEYIREGIICTVKKGRKMYYSRTPDTELSGLSDVIDFFSETAPCGVIGSYLRDKLPAHQGLFSFKHHYMTHALDSGVLAQLFAAIREGRYVTLDNLGKHSKTPDTLRLVPLKICISAQNGRQYLIACKETTGYLNTYRLDYVSNVRLEAVCPDFQIHRQALKDVERHMWGVNCRRDGKGLEHVEFDILVREGEDYIVGRLEREKRCGRVERLDDAHYRFCADVFDTSELIPWIRTFLSRITRLQFSNREAEERFREDIRRMYRMYDVEGGDAV